MAAKRFLNDEESNDQDPPAEKRLKRRPSFASVIGEVVMVNSLQNLFSSLEPLLRRVVHEEVEHVLRRCSQSISRSPSLRIQALEPSSLQLAFSKPLSLPIFTGSKISDNENNPLQVFVVDKSSAPHMMMPITLSHTIKVEVVVLDGDFPPRENNSWTSEEFESNIVKERTGKRPLLTGDLNVTVRDGFAMIGEIEFTDNSSWIRSRKFRLGARITPGTNTHGLRVREAMTDAFIVKDHRGELYKKHYPPRLEDEVWRLEKIGKEGAFHRKLASQGIKTVQDFLKLFVVDPAKLRATLGVGMSEKMWEVTLKHARTCEMGSKQYIFNGNQFIIYMNPICQVLRAEINGQIYTNREISGMNRAFIQDLIRQAYSNWNSVKEIDENMNGTALLAQVQEMVDQYPNHQQGMIRPFEQNLYLPSNAHIECSDNWQLHSPYNFPALQIQHTMSESSSEGDLTPHGLP
ncbi:protein SAR DEFICIENT 1 [Ziziphus jujuba]|uniref:Protein SAR DEFICIENT 1 n=1 Tax=Ziziphus jujuba TaxID=326968 RepID=A0ABM3IIA1_ZIZJJ|nr:protein SAR DEFICIENT 1 [Ziziphus jujuba]